MAKKQAECETSKIFGETELDPIDFSKNVFKSQNVKNEFLEKQK